MARRGQFHLSRLVEHLTPLDLPFQAWQHRVGQLFPGLPPNWHWWQNTQPLGALYLEAQRQAQMLAFGDNYWFFTIVFLALLPLVFLMRRAPKMAAGPGLGH